MNAKRALQKMAARNRFRTGVLALALASVAYLGDYLAELAPQMAIIAILIGL